MNDFYWGKIYKRFFISWIINDDFCGIAIRIGKEYLETMCCDVYHLTIQIGFGQLSIGIIGRKKE